MSEEANKVESLLFSSGRKMREDEIVQLTHLKLSDVKKGLEELKKKYDEENNSLMVINEGDNWKLSVREKYLGIVQNIVTDTELDKSIMETLAVIAWKYPILQSDVIKIRNNKAYDHLRELEEAGFIAREVKGRTRSIKLTQKFFDYFDLPKGEQTRETFRQAVPEEIRGSIERGEIEIKETEGKIEEAKTKKDEMEKTRREDKKKQKEVDLVDEFGKKTELDVYETSEEEIEQEEEMDKKTKHNLVGVEIITKKKEEEMMNQEMEKKADEIVAKIEQEEVGPEVEKRINELLHPVGYKAPEGYSKENQENDNEKIEDDRKDSEDDANNSKENEIEEKETKEEPEEEIEDKEKLNEETEEKPEKKKEDKEVDFTKQQQQQSPMEKLDEGKPEDYEDNEKRE